ncbi:MAG: hypothetical protein RIT12_724 [Actinomycetota bacterium]|jgi:uncharacterized membrane protein YgcG
MKKAIQLLMGLFLALVLTPLSPSAADVNDFSFESFDATYEISVNEAEDKRPEMVVTETLVANFPLIEQNRGIKRSIPLRSYQLYPDNIQVLSITDESGKARDYEQTTDGEFLHLAIKARDNSYVFGKQTYVIKYKQDWVLSNFESEDSKTTRSEFYWDINGTGWPQSFGRVSATVILDQALSQNVIPKSMRCYEGNYGSTGSCKVSQPSENTFVFSSTDLKATETQTIAIGFNPGVANVDGPQAVDSPSFIWFLLSLIALIAILIWAIYYRVTQLKNLGKTSIIIPQYQPPVSPDLAVSALVARKSAHLNQASVIELAIKKLIEIEQVADSKKDNFILRKTSEVATNPNHVELLKALGLSKAGDEVNLSGNMKAAEQAALAKRLLALKSKITRQVNSGGYFKKRALGIPALVFVGVLLATVILFASAIAVDAESVSLLTAIPFLFVFPYLLTYWIILSKRVMTAKGVEVEDYLKGMKMYIELAEKDRLDFLQSPKGASLTPSQVKGRSVLKLYEEVLPWAILLGLHKQWNGVLNNLYEKDTTPVWFVGAPVFSDSFSSLDRILAQSLSVDSSGGSGGGGSAGGGSGGGGGGGI